MDLHDRVKKLELQLELERLKHFALLDFVVARLNAQVADHCARESSVSPIELFRSTSDIDRTIVAFGGNAMKLGLPAAEFSKHLTSRGLAVVFIKDFYQAWYQRGLIGMSSDITSTIDVVCKLNQEWRSDRFIGTSAGGYAAILFGCKSAAKEIIAFAPQTVLNHDNVKIFSSQDTRLQEVLKINNKDFLDLLPIVESHQQSTVHIHYGCRNVSDKAAAERLGHLSNVRLYPMDFDGHNIAKFLRDQGKLDKALGPVLQ